LFQFVVVFVFAIPYRVTFSIKVLEEPWEGFGSSFLVGIGSLPFV